MAVTTTASFVIPAVGANVAVAVTDTSQTPVNTVLNVFDGTHACLFQVVSIASSTAFTLELVALLAGSVGNTMASSASVLFASAPLSSLPTVTTPAGSDYLYIVQGGTSYKATVANEMAAYALLAGATFTGLVTCGDGLTVSGAVTSIVGGSALASSGGGYVQIGTTGSSAYFVALDYEGIQSYFHNPSTGIGPTDLYVNYQTPYAFTHIGKLALATVLATTYGGTGTASPALTLPTPTPLSQSGTWPNISLSYSDAGPEEIQSGQAQVGTGTSISVTLPFGAPTSGHLLLAFIIGSVNQTPTAPSGWTNAYSYFSGFRMDCFYKVSAGTETTTAWSVGSASYWGVYVSETNRTSFSTYASVLAGESTSSASAWTAANGTFSARTLIFATWGASISAGGQSFQSLSADWTGTAMLNAPSTSYTEGFLSQRFANWGETVYFAPKFITFPTISSAIMAGIWLT